MVSISSKRVLDEPPAIAAQEDGGGDKGNSLVAIDEGRILYQAETIAGS